MHLSLLSDTSIAPAASVLRADPAGSSGLGRAHLDGLLRGLVFLAAIAVPLGLAIATGHAGQQNPSAGYAQTFDAGR